MKSTQTNPQARCPACLKQSDGATDMRGNATPKPGDICVCIYCSAINSFNADLTLRPLTVAEWNELPAAMRLELDHYCETARAVVNHDRPAKPPAR